jgi:hypothetical protein
MEAVAVGAVIVAVGGALVARYVYGVTWFHVGYWGMMKLPWVGQMMHDTALAKHRGTFHSKPAMHGEGKGSGSDEGGGRGG